MAKLEQSSPVMAEQHWEQVEQLFKKALELCPEERIKFLATSFAGEDALRKHVETLLDAHEDARRFIESAAGLNPAPKPISDSDAQKAQETRNLEDDSTSDETLASPAARSLNQLRTQSIDWPLTPYGRYAVAGEHARGGIGRILNASDRRLTRPVAVKELLTANPQAEARFIREALVTARLQHPAIVPIYEVGRWPTGNPFYTMKMVSGRSLAEVILEKRSLAERLALLPNVIAVADAMAYAHEQKIIHRDLKPANVMIGPFGETMVIDWGLAADLSQLAESPERNNASIPSTGLTIAGAVLGTPEYMPPEQAMGSLVDQRADVYAIGALFYHVLAGVPPYEGDNSKEILAKVINDPPLPIEQLHPGIPADLAAVVRKAMARDPALRYPSAKELAEDLKRFQTGQLVSAHVYSTFTLLLRWLRRYRAPVGVAAVFLVALAVVLWVSFQRVIRERNVAEARKNQLTLAQAQAVIDQDPTAALAWLKTYPDGASNWQAVRDIAFDAYARGVARHVFRISEELRPIYAEFSPDATLLASAGQDKTIRVRRISDGKTVRVFQHAATVNSLKFSPNGKAVAVGDEEGVLELYDLESGSSRLVRRHGGPVKHIAFSPRGDSIASASSDQTLGLFNLITGEALSLEGHRGPVLKAAFSPDGSLVASAGQLDATIRLWNAKTQQAQVLSGHTDNIYSVAFSPDGKAVASAGRDGVVRLWTMTSGESRALLGHAGPISEVAFSPDGKLVASGGWDQTVRVWDTASGLIRSLLIGHMCEVYSLAFSPDGRNIASAGRDGVVRVWDAGTGDPLVVLRGHKSAVYQIAFSPDGKHLVSTSMDKTIRVWHRASDEGRILRGHTDDVFQVAFAPTGHQLASVSKDTTVRLWDTMTGEAKVFAGHKGVVLHAAFSPDGNTLASASSDRTARLWEVATGKHLVLNHEANVWYVVFSPDGRRVATTSGDNTVQLWDMTGGEKLVFQAMNEVPSVSFAPNGMTLLAGGRDNVIKLWDIATGRRRDFRGHQDFVYRVLFSPNGELIGSASNDRTVRLWDVGSGQGRVLGVHEGRPLALVFSSDGKMLASGGEENTIRLWHLSSGESEVLSSRDQVIHDLAFSPDNKYLVSGSHDGAVRLWEVAARSSRLFHRHRGYVSSVTFSPDGRYLASASADQTVWLAPIDLDSALVPEQQRLRSWLETVSSAIIDTKDREGTPEQ